MLRSSGMNSMLSSRNATSQPVLRARNICWVCSFRIDRRLKRMSSFNVRPSRFQSYPRELGEEALTRAHTNRFFVVNRNRDPLSRRRRAQGQNLMHPNDASMRPMLSLTPQTRSPIANLRCFSTRRQFNRQQATTTRSPTRSSRQNLQAWETARSMMESREKAFKAPSVIRGKLAEFQATIDSASNEEKAALGKAFAHYTAGPQLLGKQTEEIEDLDEDIEENRATSNHDIAADEFMHKAKSDPLPGDLLEYIDGDECKLLLLVNSFRFYDDTGGSQHQLISDKGTWIHYNYGKLSKASWIVRNFVDIKELAQIRQNLPNEPILEEQLAVWNPAGWYLPPEIAQPVTEKLLDFARKVDAIWRENASRIDNAFEIVAKPNESIWLTVEDIARKILQKSKTDQLSAEENYVVHRACIAYNAGFHPDKHHSVSHLIEVYSRKDAELVEQVRKWVREHRESVVQKLESPQESGSRSVLERFADEVRPIILRSRQSRSLHKDVLLGTSNTQLDALQDSGLSYTIVQGSKISSPTSMILRFLEMLAARSLAAAHISPLSSVRTAILRTLGLYGESEASIVRDTDTSVLKECGIIPPWGSTASRGITQIDPYSVNNTYMAASLRGAQEESDQGKFEIDTMKDYRRDFGTMPVFCIDSASTVDIDDGISLEACPEADTYWVHTHVANPTAFIPFESQTVEFARKMGSTAYLLDHTSRMLPVDCVTRQFSLASNRPTLTISTKINGDGILLDHKIQNGFVRNVHHVTPETVRRSLGHPHSIGNRQSWVIGKFPPKESQYVAEHTTLAPEAVEILRTMERLGTAWERNIQKRSGLDWTMNDFREVDVRVHHVQQEEPRFENFRQFIGDPTITYTMGNVLNESWDNGQYQGLAGKVMRGPVRDLVANIMIMTNHSVAQWCHRRGIPALFRGSVRDKEVFSSSSIQDLIQRMAQPLSDPLQWSADSTILKRLVLPKTFFRSSRIARHDLLGVDGYIAATSPLRRYGDMYVHYQIESVLRAESRMRRQLEGTDSNELAFSEAAVRKAIDFDISRGRALGLRLTTNNHSWQDQVWLRGGLLRECSNFPEFVTAYVCAKDNDTSIPVVLKEFGTRWSLSRRLQPKFEEVQAGQIWKMEFRPKDILAGVELVASERIG